MLLCGLVCASQSTAQTQVNWSIVEVTTSLGSPLDQVRIGETVTIRSRVNNPASEALLAIQGSYDGYDPSILGFLGGDAVSGVFYAACSGSSCFNGFTNVVIPPLVEASFGVEVLSAFDFYSVDGSGEIDPGLDGVVGGGDAEFEVVFEALEEGSTLVYVGRNPTDLEGESIVLSNGEADYAITDQVAITVVPDGAAEVTYAYTGNAFDEILGGGSPFTTSDSVSGYFSLPGPLAPNLVDEPIANSVSRFALSAGPVSLDDTNAWIFSLEVSTDAAGSITEWVFWLLPLDTVVGQPVQWVVTASSTSEGVADRAVECTWNEMTLCDIGEPINEGRILDDPGSWSVHIDATCENGFDDDGDGFVDLQDPGCAGPDDPSETHLRPGDYVIANADEGSVHAFQGTTTRLATIARSSGLVEPWDVLVDASGEVLVTDASQDALMIVDPESGAVTPLSAGGSMSVPTGLARDVGGDLLVAQNLSDVILAVDPVTGGQTTILSDPSITDVDDLLLDPTDGSLLVSDPTNGLFRVNDPLGAATVLPFATSTIQQSRQVVFDGSGDLVLADDILNAPVRLDLTTGSETPLVPGAPFSSLQGAAAEPGGPFLFTDYVTGEIVRIDDAQDTVSVLNVGREAPGLRHLSVVPTPAEVTLSLIDAIVVDGGASGVADPGDTLQLTALVTNAGSGAADQLSLESGLDPNLALVSGSLTTTQGTIIEGSLASDPRIEVDLGSLAPAASATVHWEVVVSDPAPARSVSANAWVRRDKLILAESDDPSTAPRPDANVIGVGDFGIVVQAVTKLSDTRGDLSGLGNPGSVVGLGGLFGGSAEPIGDIDGDGVTDMAVGAYQEALGGSPNFGAFFILLLNPDGTVKQRFRWDANSADLTLALLTAGFGLGDDNLGSSIAYLGDLDGAGPSDFALAVGAWYDDGLGGTDRGALYVLFMDASPLQVLSATKIGDGAGGFPSGQLSDFDYFGMDIENVGDIDGDGVVDLAVGAHLDDTVGTNAGGVWILFLTPSGTVKASPPLQILVSPSSSGDYLGLGIAGLGLFDGDAVPDLAVGATRRDTGGVDRGAVWILTLNADGTVKTQTEISPGVGGFPSDILEDDDRFGNDLEVLPDLDEDGTVELLVGASRDDDAGVWSGAVYVLFLDPTGTVDRTIQLAPGPGVLLNELRDEDRFGLAIAPLGDLDGDGFPEIAVGAPLDNDGATNAGAVYVLHTAIPVPEPGVVTGIFSGLVLWVSIGAKRTRRPARRIAAAGEPAVASAAGRGGCVRARFLRHSSLFRFVLLLALVLAPVAWASSGVREINQTCAVEIGCFAGDVPGFPVTIDAAGSYRLTSNLALPGDVDAVVITTSHVTIDLNGFEIAGTGICTGVGPTLDCGGGSGNGIFASGGPVGIAIENGTIRNMPESGINLAGQGHRVHSLVLRHNGSFGVAADFRTSCSSCTALENGTGGIRLNSGGIVDRSIASGNGGNGIEISGVGQGGVVSDSTSQFNAGAGVSILDGGVVTGTAAFGNAGNGIESPGVGATVAAVASAGNAAAGIVLSGGSSLSASAARGNLGDGVDAASHVVVNAVASTGNNGMGLNFGDGANVGQVSASGNGESGLSAGAGVVVLGVSARGNNGSGIVGGVGSVAVESSATANGADGFGLSSHSTIAIASAVANGDLESEVGIDLQHGVISLASTGQNGGPGARIGDGVIAGLASRDAGAASAAANPDSLICGSCAITGSSIEGQVATISGVTWASAIRQANGICGAPTFTGPEMAVGAAHVCGSSPVVGNASLRIGCTRDPSLGLICP